jgi:hypothetical protein
MLSRFARTAGAARSRFSLEAFEPRLVMDASYQYLDNLANLPPDFLGGNAASNPVVLDDINGDGIRDIAASGTRTQSGVQGNTISLGFVGIYSGADGALIREIPEVSYPYYGHYYSPFGQRMVLLGDLNSDGVRDLAISDFENSVDDVGYGAFRVFSPKTGQQLLAIASNVSAYNYRAFLGSPGDLDADGQSDIIVTGFFPTQIGGQNVTTRAYSARTGSIIWEAAIGALSDQYFTRSYRTIVPVGDVNSDDIPDILIGGDDGSISFGDSTRGYLALVSGASGALIREWLPAAGDLGFGSQVVFMGDANNDTIGEFAFITHQHQSADPTSAIVATLNFQDLTNTAINAPTWSVSLGTWVADINTPLGFANIGDFNNDGKPDIAVMINPSSRASLLRIVSGADGATLQDITTTDVRPDRSRTSGVINYGLSVAAGDLNNDGFTDLLVGASMAESPREGQPYATPFLAVVPTIRFRPVTITSISPAGIVSGTIDSKPFFTLNRIITPVAGFKGLLAGDKLFDVNAAGLALGSPNSDGSNAFLLENGVRTLLSTLPTRDLFSPTGDFTSKPAGAYSTPFAFRLAADAKAGIVKLLRDGATPTTWILQRNSVNSGYELVYLFDGDPVDIAPSGTTVAANRTDGTGLFLANDLRSEPQLYASDDFRAVVVADGAVAGYSADAKSAKVGFVAPPTGLFGPVYSVSVLKSSDAPIASSFRLIGLTALPTGSVLTFEPAATPDEQVKLWSRDEALVWSSTNIDHTDLTGVPGPFNSFNQTPFALAPNSSILAAVSLDAAPAVASRFVPDAASGPFLFDPAKPIASAPVDESGAAMIGFNAFGQVIYIRRGQESDFWVAEELPVPAGATVYDVTVWNNGAALATSQGLIRLSRDAAGQWDSLNLTTSLTNASGIGRSLRSFFTIDRYLIVTGLNADNQVVIYGSSAPDPDKNTAWSYDNISVSVLTAFNIPDPQLQGDLVTYVMPWNGLNIAGINAAGQPVSFWTAPGVSGWRFTNLADAQEDPSLANGFTRLAVNVTPWGGVSVTNADDSLRTVWWAPALGGLWKFAALADAVFDAPRPLLQASSVVAFATTWGGQNIAGVDANGHLWVYWWSPESNAWTATSLQSAVPDLDNRVFSPRITAYATGGNVPMGVSAVDADNHGLHLYFKIGTGWLSSDATAAVDPTL